MPPNRTFRPRTIPEDLNVNWRPSDLLDGVRLTLRRPVTACDASRTAKEKHMGMDWRLLRAFTPLAPTTIYQPFCRHKHTLLWTIRRGFMYPTHDWLGDVLLLLLRGGCRFGRDQMFVLLLNPSCCRFCEIDDKCWLCPDITPLVPAATTLGFPLQHHWLYQSFPIGAMC